MNFKTDWVLSMQLLTVVNQKVLIQTEQLSVGETRLGNTATDACNSGRVDLVGSSTVTCLASGQWSDGAATCQRQ